MPDTLTLRIQPRAATPADIPFLAEVAELASIPPFEQSMWTPLVAPFGVTPRAFVAAMLEAEASNWGTVEDFLVLELDGRPAAACAVYDATRQEPHRRELRLARLPALAARLGWDAATAEAFRARYEAEWGEVDPALLHPQAPAIIETVGVLPAHRGLGLGDRLMQEAKQAARRRGHAAIGIQAIHGNDRAIALYDRHFERWTTLHAAALHGRLPGVTRFRAAL